MRVSATSWPARVTARVALSNVRSPTWNDDLMRGRSAPAERADPREQHRKRKRLDQVVVGAGVEAGDDVACRVTRGQHQHRGLVAARAQPADDFDAVKPRQHQVEHDHVEAPGRGGVGRLGSGGGLFDGVALLAEAAPNDGAHPRVVFHEQETHAVILSSGARCRKPGFRHSSDSNDEIGRRK